MAETLTLAQHREKIESDRATLERQRVELESVEQRLVSAKAALILGEGNPKEVKRLTDERADLTASVDKLQIEIQAHESALVTLEQREAATATDRTVREIIAPAHREMQAAADRIPELAQALCREVLRYTSANTRIRAAWPFGKSDAWRLPDLQVNAFGHASPELQELLGEVRAVLWAASGGMFAAPSPMLHHSQMATYVDTHPQVGAHFLQHVPAMLEEFGFGEVAAQLRAPAAGSVAAAKEAA